MISSITKLKSYSNVFKIATLSGLVSGARFIYMFYFSTIDKSNPKGVADLIFIIGNNALFVSLFSSLVLIPIAQYKRYNLNGILLFLFLSILTSFLWNSIYGYSFLVVCLTVFLLISNLFYEFVRRTLFIVHPKEVTKLDLSITLSVLIALGIFIFKSWSIHYFLFIVSLCFLSTSLYFVDFKNFKNQFEITDLVSFFKLNHSGFGQSLLMFIASNTVFQLVNIYGDSKVFTKVNFVRIWVAPLGLILNALEFVFSRDKFEGNVPNKPLIFTLLGSIVSIIFLKNELLLYSLGFLVIVPFQFWLKSIQINLRQKELHSRIWFINVLFTVLSVVFSFLFILSFDWQFWSWYILLTYFILWIILIYGKKTD